MNKIQMTYMNMKSQSHQGFSQNGSVLTAPAIHFSALYRRRKQDSQKVRQIIKKYDAFQSASHNFKEEFKLHDPISNSIKILVGQNPNRPKAQEKNSRANQLSSRPQSSPKLQRQRKRDVSANISPTKNQRKTSAAKVTQVTDLSRYEGDINDELNCPNCQSNRLKYKRMKQKGKKAETKLNYLTENLRKNGRGAKLRIYKNLSIEVIPSKVKINSEETFISTIVLLDQFLQSNQQQQKIKSVQERNRLIEQLANKQKVLQNFLKRQQKTTEEIKSLKIININQRLQLQKSNDNYQQALRELSLYKAYKKQVIPQKTNACVNTQSENHQNSQSKLKAQNQRLAFYLVSTEKQNEKLRVQNQILLKQINSSQKDSDKFNLELEKFKKEKEQLSQMLKQTRKNMGLNKQRSDSREQQLVRSQRLIKQLCFLIMEEQALQDIIDSIKGEWKGQSQQWLSSTLYQLYNQWQAGEGGVVFYE